MYPHRPSNFIPSYHIVSKLGVEDQVKVPDRIGMVESKGVITKLSE